MIDRTSRDRLGELLRRLAGGRITNDEFEDAVPFGSSDLAVREVAFAAWILDGDLREHRLVGRGALGRDARCIVARWIVFLHSDADYRRPRHPLVGIPRLLVDVLTLGSVTRRVDERRKRAGDNGVWPFLRRAEYERALRNPRSLAPARA